MSRWFDIAWLFLWGAASSAWCLTAAGELSAAFDEPNNLRWGMTSWRTGSNYSFMRAGTMPLPVDVQYLPMHVWEWARGKPFAIEIDSAATEDFHAILPYARAMNLVFWWLLLTYGLLVARDLGGPWAGRWAVVLIATEPSLLGHAALALTDIAISAMILVFAFHYHRGRERGRWGRWVFPGILFGLALATKASALTFVPLIMLAFEIPRLNQAGAFRPPLGVGRIRHLWRVSSRFRWDFAKVFGLGMVVLFAYCGCDWRPQPSFVKEADKLADGHWAKEGMTWLSRHLTVFPNAGEALAYQIKHNMRGHGAYLLGEFHPRAVWYYFPVALSIKLTVPILGLLATFLLFRPRMFLTPIALAALFLFVFSFNTRVQIGVRIVFPLVVMILLTLANGLARATAAWSNRGHGAALAVVSAALIYPPLSTWPDGLRYANELYGGPSLTHRYLAESNNDWGQGLKDLDRWTEQRDLPTAKVWYYGMDPVLGNDPDRLRALHWPKYDIQRPEDTWKWVRGDVIAVGEGMLYGNPHLSPTMPNVIEFFKRQRPIGRTRNFLVYDFREPAKP